MRNVPMQTVVGGAPSLTRRASEVSARRPRTGSPTRKRGCVTRDLFCLSLAYASGSRRFSEDPKQTAPGRLLGSVHEHPPSMCHIKNLDTMLSRRNANLTALDSCALPTIVTSSFSQWSLDTMVAMDSMVPTAPALTLSGFGSQMPTTTSAQCSMARIPLRRRR
jgi:hypothetical protein